MKEEKTCSASAEGCYMFPPGEHADTCLQACRVERDSNPWPRHSVRLSATLAVIAAAFNAEEKIDDGTDI